MSETTQILFNSPALHSLKRDQLVKLCKIHSIKASGKSVELVDRLKQHAKTLPPNEPLSVAARNEGAPDKGDMAVGAAMPRPSEQWEMVMDDIEEETDSQGGTMSSVRTTTGMRAAGEFGTGGSKSSSVSSSIKALATSLGLKRTGTNKSASSLSIATSATMTSDHDDDLQRLSKPYDSLPEVSPDAMPQTDHFKLSTPDASFAEIPGQPSRAGRPADPNARLSTGEGLTTTIRLVSAANPFSYAPDAPGTPQLKPFATDFDLLTSPGVDGESRVPVWPLSPEAAGRQSLYPSLASLPKPTLEGTDVAMTNSPRIAVNSPRKGSMQRTNSQRRTPPKPTNDVQDIFSPAPASSSLAPPGSTSLPRSQPFIFGSPLPQNSVSNKAFGSAAASVLEEMNRRLSAAGAQKVGTDFLEAKPDMPIPSASFGSTSSKQGLDRFNKAHEDQFNKMDSIANHYAARRGAPGQVPGSNKRKSDAIGKGPTPGAKRTSAGTRVISNGVRKKMGVPGGFGDDDESEEEEEEDRRMSKRIRVVEGDGGRDKGKRVSLAPDVKADDKVSEKDKKEKEKERKAVRKMLDMKREKRRSSIRRVSGVRAQPPQNKPKGATSRFGFLSSAKSMVRSVWNMGSKAPAPSSNIPVPKVQAAPAKVVIEEKKESTSTTMRKPSVSKCTFVQGAVSDPSIQLDVFQKFCSIYGPLTGREWWKHCCIKVQRLNKLVYDQFQLKVQHPNEFRNHSILHRYQGHKFHALIQCRSIVFSLPRASSSRLFAPTASSLAKTRGSISGLPKVNEKSTPKSPSSSSTSPLDQITNSTAGASKIPRASPTKIFSKPLSAASSPSLVPKPIQPTSLAAAASTLAD
ncbi:hypothetical protein EWM64_g4483, partial [Hericium alpestre]